MTDEEKRNMAQFLNFKGDYKGLSEKKASDNLNMYGNNIFTETAATMPSRILPGSSSSG